MFLPLLSPIHSNFFNLWKWNTAWLTSCEDLPTPTLTHKYLLSSQHFGRRPSVFIVHSSFWKSRTCTAVHSSTWKIFQCVPWGQKGFLNFLHGLSWDVKGNLHLGLSLFLAISLRRCLTLVMSVVQSWCVCSAGSEGGHLCWWMMGEHLNCPLPTCSTSTAPVGATGQISPSTCVWGNARQCLPRRWRWCGCPSSKVKA